MVTFSEGTNISVAVSPDEDFMVFDLQGTLFKKGKEKIQAQPLTGHFMDARQPDISPDGKRIAFQSYQDGNWHIWSVNQDGSNLRQLTAGLYDQREPHFAPNGSNIVFSSDQSGTYDIWIHNEISGDLSPLTSSDYNDYGPAYSYCGDAIAFVRQTPDQWELNIISLGSNKIKTLYHSPAKIYAPSWYSNDSIISFIEHDWLVSQLKSIDIKTGEVRNITTEEEDVFPFRAQHRSDASYYTSDGHITKLVSGQKQTIPFEATLPIDINKYKRKEPRLVEAQSQKVKGIHCPQLSPDGEKISFIALGDVWIKHLNSDELIRVTDDSYVQLMPAWHPNGKTLVYASDKGNRTALWEYDIKNAKTRKLGHITTMPSGVSFSPDGGKIAYTMAFGPRSGRLSIMDYNTGESRSPRPSFPYSTSAPSWHPDGQYILMSMLQPYSGLYREGIARNIIIDSETGETSVQQAPPDLSFGARTNDVPLLVDGGKTLVYISRGQLKEVQLDHALNVIGKEMVIFEELSDAPSINKSGDKILVMSGSQLKIINRSDGSIENVAIDLEYQHSSDHPSLTIHAGTVITMNNEILKNQDIIIKGQKIMQIVPHEDRKQSLNFIDASNQFVIPGLIDMHAHQGSDLGTSLGHKWLAWGVTSTRDPATYPYDAQNRKEAQINGNILHPRIFYTGSPIDGNRVYYNGTYAQYSEQQIRRELQRSEALNYDLIKTYVRLPDSLQLLVIERAHQLGLPVTSHELYPAALMGVDGVEHILGTSRRGYTPKMSETYKSYSDVPTMMATAGMTFTPTIGIYSGYNYMLFKNPDLLDEQRIEVLEGAYVKSSARAGIKLVEESPAEYEIMFRRQSELIQKAYEKGVTIVAGTDSPILPYGFGLFIELMCYQEAGLSPMEVLKTATVNASKALNTSDQLGQIKVGMIADLLILNEDPTRNIKNLKTIDRIILSGKVLPMDELLLPFIEENNDRE
ncbi:amidohydrolase family protein [Portibacter marinus]|uniref:amidohydrolase family protein n=1 Tax=Portibacter marinus TaxID=2898660 RepID=UPI001F2F7A72|nr:amidohydrolase family protein [Portibacter marinus]